MIFHLSLGNSPETDSPSTTQTLHTRMTEEFSGSKIPTNYHHAPSYLIANQQQGDNSPPLKNIDSKSLQPYIDTEEVTIFPLSVNSSHSPQYTRSSRSRISHRARQFSEQNITLDSSKTP